MLVFHAKFTKILEKSLCKEAGVGVGGVLRGTCGGRRGGDLPRDGLHVARLQW